LYAAAKALLSCLCASPEWYLSPCFLLICIYAFRHWSIPSAMWSSILTRITIFSELCRDRFYLWKSGWRLLWHVSHLFHLQTKDPWPINSNSWYTSKYKMERTIMQSDTSDATLSQLILVSKVIKWMDKLHTHIAFGQLENKVRLLILLNCHKQLYSNYIAVSSSQDFLASSQAMQNINKQRTWMGQLFIQNLVHVLNND
jgi:hypothetical protein